MKKTKMFFLQNKLQKNNIENQVKLEKNCEYLVLFFNILLV